MSESNAELPTYHIVNYDPTDRSDLERFQAAVNKWLELGYELHGGPAISFANNAAILPGYGSARHRLAARRN